MMMMMMMIGAQWEAVLPCTSIDEQLSSWRSEQEQCQQTNYYYKLQTTATNYYYKLLLQTTTTNYGGQVGPDKNNANRQTITTRPVRRVCIT